MSSYHLWSRGWKVPCAPWLAIVLFWRLVPDGESAIGFCMDNVPTALVGTGFAAVNTIAQGDCADWCPLSDYTKDWTTTDHGTITYYYYSPCCSGKQGYNLIVDYEHGLPTCKSSTNVTTCTRQDWTDKLSRDLVDFKTSGYRKMVTPVSIVPNSSVYKGVINTPECVCEPSDPGCSRVTSDGKTCLICDTDRSCGPDTVTVSMNFFKIVSADLKTSEMSFSVWLRGEWYDHRLSYDYQCYGGLEYFDVVVESGAQYNTQIWTPDMELYNGAENIWHGSLVGRTAAVYACWDGAPSRGGCGYVFLSRPGIITALCRFSGLVRFPFDILQCQLEFAPWGVDGRFQDLVLRSRDGGVEWWQEDSNTVSGLTAGSSFQDYRIKNIVAHRTIVRYPSSPHALWPELIYTVTFKRSSSFYVFLLIIPGCLLTFLSFLAFWMNPEVTDRLGYGVTNILAMVTQAIVSSDYMPVCQEKVLMDYLSIAFLVFGCLSLVETAVVLYMHQRDCENWFEAFIPRWMRGVLAGNWATCGKDRPDRKPEDIERRRVNKDDKNNKDVQLRKQQYQQIFYAIDNDFNGTLSLDEIEEFGYFIVGGKWDAKEAEEFIKSIDESWDGVLDFEEFATFCEDKLLVDYKDDPRALREMIKGFSVVLEKKGQSRALMWKNRAYKLDQFCRWAIPPGFCFFGFLCWMFTEEQLNYISTRKGSQAAVILAGLYPIMFIFLTQGIYLFTQSNLFNSVVTDSRLNLLSFSGKGAKDAASALEAVRNAADIETTTEQDKQLAGQLMMEMADHIGQSAFDLEVTPRSEGSQSREALLNNRDGLAARPKGRGRGRGRANARHQLDESIA